MSECVAAPPGRGALRPEACLEILCAIVSALAKAGTYAEIIEILIDKLCSCPGVVSVNEEDTGATQRPLFNDGVAAIPLPPSAAMVVQFTAGVVPGTAALDFLRAVGVIATDALERVRLRAAEAEAVAAAAQQRSYLNKLLENMPSGVAIAEAPSGRLLLHNTEAVKMLRHPLRASADVSAYRQYGAMHAPDRPYAPDEYPIARALRGETVRRERMLYRRGDGTIGHFLVNAAPLRGANGAIESALSTFEDISELMESQHALETVSERLGRVLESTTDSVLVADPEWRIRYMNRRAQADIGRGRDLIGMELWDAFPEALGTVIEDAYREVAASGRDRHFEAYYEPFDTWYEIHAHPDQGGLIVFFRDINERKQTEREREQLLESLRESEAQARRRLAEIEAIYESAPIGLCVFDSDLRCVRINRRLAEMNGLSPEEHIGK